MTTPAESLLGTRLNDQWSVVELVPKDPFHTGGHFSVQYIVESDGGERAFLKALDFQKLITPGSTDVVSAIAEMTMSFEFERDLLRKCRNEGLKRIIRSLSDGQVVVAGIAVPFIIFEIAESDVRRQANVLNRFDTAWSLRTMHHVAVGIQQLHSREIAHQDLKPSNVLVVSNGERKIGDLGRSVTKDCTLKHADLCIVGDVNHAPPEGLYKFRPPDWRERRYGCDLYQVGSLLVFMLTGMSCTTILLEHLEEEHRPNMWGGTYSEALPFLIEAFPRVIEYISNLVDEDDVKSDVNTLIRELTHPDVSQRGDPVKRGMGANPFSMERYISRFDRLAKKLEFSLTH